MKHPISRELFAYWDSKRGNRDLPDRRDMEPSLLRKILGDSFLLAFDPAAGNRFRLAGTRVCALFGRELRDERFCGLWDSESIPTIATLLSTMREERIGVVASAIGTTKDGKLLPLEISILPLRHFSADAARMIGVIAPLETPYWIGASSIDKLTLGNYRFIRTDGERKRTNVEQIEVAQRPELTVFQGGRI